MKTNKPRNRESRTKPIPTESSVAIRMRLPRESYDKMRDLVKNRRATKEDIFRVASRPTATVIPPYAFPSQRVAGITLER